MGGSDAESDSRPRVFEDQSSYVGAYGFPLTPSLGDPQDYRLPNLPYSPGGTRYTRERLAMERMGNSYPSRTAQEQFERPGSSTDPETLDILNAMGKQNEQNAEDPKSPMHYEA